MLNKNSNDFLSSQRFEEDARFAFWMNAVWAVKHQLESLQNGAKTRSIISATRFEELAFSAAYYDHAGRRISWHSGAEQEQKQEHADLGMAFLGADQENALNVRMIANDKTNIEISEFKVSVNAWEWLLKLQEDFEFHFEEGAREMENQKLKNRLKNGDHF